MKKTMILLVMNFLWLGPVFAVPPMLSYQGRILNSDGKPLEYANVSFLFQITSANGSCVLYEEQLNGVNMSNSGGVFDAPIGLGTRLFPVSGSSNILDAFNNSSTHMDCKGGASYSPSIYDYRRLRVQFHDGTGWRMISPDNIIRTMPFAAYSLQASKVGRYAADQLVIKDVIPTCAAGTYLTWDGDHFVCEAISGATGGTVTLVTSTNPYLTVTNASSTPALSINVGTTANTVAAGNDPRFTNARAPSGAASGDLGDSYPNPKVVKIQGVDVSNNTPNEGQVLKYSSSTWMPTSLTTSDIAGLSSSLSGMVQRSQLPPSCAASQTLTFSSPSGSFSCSDIAISGSAFGHQTAGVVFAGPTSGSAIPTFRALQVADLPASILNGAWTADGSGNISRTSGNVGIGIGTPSEKLEVVGKVKATELCIGIDCRSTWPISSSGGTVTSVTSATTDIAVATSTTTPVLTLNSGTGAHQILKLDASGRMAASALPALTGDVTSVAGATATTLAAIKSIPLTISSLTSGNYLKYNGSAWVNHTPSVADLSDANSLIKSSQMPANCSAGQTLTFSSPTGTWACSTLIVTASNFASQNQNTVLAAPVGGNGIPTFRALQASDLPASITDGAWTASAGNVHRATGQVGIGTTTPGDKLDVAGRIRATHICAPDGTNCKDLTAAWSGGSVTSVTSANTDISVATTTTTPVLTLNTGTGANQILKLNASSQIPAVSGALLTNLNAASVSSGTLPAARLPGLSGDVTSAVNTNTTTVEKIRGRTVAATAPTDGQVLKWNNTTSLWEPAADNSGGGGGTVTAVTGTAPISVATGTTTPAISLNASGVTTTHLANGAVTDEKIDTVSVNKVSSGASLYFTYAPNNVACTNGQVLKKTANGWECGTDSAGSGTVTSVTSANTDISIATTTTTPVLTLNTGTGANQILKLNASSQIPAVSGALLTNLNAANLSSGTLPATRLPGLSGDVTSAVNTNTTTVEKIRGRTVAATAPTNGQILKWNNTNSQWEPAADDSGGAGTVTSVALTLPSLFTVSGSPVTSSGTLTGTLATQAQNTVFAGPLSGSAAPSFRTLRIADIKSSVSGNFLTGATCTASQALAYSSVSDTISCQTISGTTPAGTAGGDLSGSYPNPTVARFQGRTLAATAPTNGQVLRWDNTNSQWEPSSDGSALTTLNASNLSSGSIPAARIAAGTITDTHIANGTITSTSLTSALANGLWTVNGADIGRPSGNVGIGTTDPSKAKFVVNGVVGETTAIFKDGSNSGVSIYADYPTVGFNSYHDGSTIRSIKAGYGADIFLAPASGQLAIRSTAGAATANDEPMTLTERVSILPNGNVGIGTTNPIYRLMVSGSTFSSSSMMLQRTEDGGSGPSLDFRSSRGPLGQAASQTLTSQEIAQLNFYGTNEAGNIATTASAAIRAIAAEDTKTTSAGGGLSFRTTRVGTNSLTEKMRISDEGDVGVGSSDPMFGIPYATEVRLLSVVGDGLQSASSAGGIAVGNNRPTPTAGDSLGVLDFLSVNNGTSTRKIGARVQSWLSGSGGANGFGADLVFFTKPDNVAFSNAHERVRILSNGNMGIGTASPSYRLHVVGDTYTSGYFRSPNGTIQTSDARFKDNVQPIENALEKILNIRGVTYDWKREEFPEQAFSEKHQMGVLAQEVEVPFPEAVITDKDGYKAVNYSSLVAPLINAVKELYAKLLGHDDILARQTREIASKVDREDFAKVVQTVKNLEKENTELKERLNKLEKILSAK